MSDRLSERADWSGVLVTAIVVGFVVLLALSALFFEGIVGTGSFSIFQGFLSDLNVLNEQPTPFTDALHLLIGFAIAVAGYVAFISPRSRSEARAEIDRGWSGRQQRGALALVGLTALFLGLILAKGLLFDVPFEGTTPNGLAEDWATYGLGLGLGWVAMYWGSSA